MEGQDLDRFRGLDMSHGFIKSIVKNQIDRDEYHKVMEERKIEVQRKIRESRRRKTLPPVEYKLYVPPHLRGKPSEDVQTKEAADRRNPCPAIVSELEETTLRERIPSIIYHLSSCSSGRQQRFHSSLSVSECSSESSLFEGHKEAFRRNLTNALVRNRVQSRHEDVLNLCPVGGESMQSSTPSRPIFLLNLKKNSGDFVDVAVMSTDNAARLAKELGRKHGLTDDQCRMLRLTLERELEARLAS